LIVGGKDIVRSCFKNASPFYQEYSYEIANAGALDVAQAIGNARASTRPETNERARLLRQAASAFSYAISDVEHAVRMTGMPISVVHAHFKQIAPILQGLAAAANERFPMKSEALAFHSERLGDGARKLLLPDDGFCYVVTPGNDVRVVAMVAANLCSAGVPFIVKASREDAVAPLVIRALVDGGFDPRFCGLVYFDVTALDAPAKHFKLVDACSIVWTFGSDDTVDRVLRHERKRGNTYLDISDLVNGSLR